MENEITKMFGLLNLSKPILEDNVTGKLVSFKLNTSERNAILNGFNDKQINDLIESANDYFRENEVVFYKNSRWSKFCRFTPAKCERRIGSLSKFRIT